MKKRILKLRTMSCDIRSIIDILKNNSNIIMLLSLFTIGLIIGTASVFNSENFRIIISLICRDTDNFVQPFVNGIFLIYLILTVNFIMGLCLVGEPIVCFLSVFAGIYISSKYAMQIFINGYENILSFMFRELIFYILLYAVLMCSQLFSLMMSHNLKHYCCGNTNSLSLKSYLMKYLCLTAVSSVIIFLKALTVQIF